MRILYIGTDSGTSGQRAAATRRLGHEVRLLDPGSLLPSGRLTAKWIWSTGALGVSEVVRRRMMEMLRDENFDVAWVDHGVLVGPGLVRDLKARIPTVLCYNVDDPFGPRDGMRWRTYLKAVPFYDLLVVVREENVGEAFRAGAQRVMHVYRSADEVAHAPRRLPAVEFEQWRSEVVFVGTAFPERGPFFVELIRRGVPLTIYGERYNRLPEWRVLKPHWRPANTGSIEGYANALSAAQVCLGLLSKGNLDLHPQRSLEIPSLGAALCAERTSEHSALYEEDREAVFWTSAEECAAKCRALLGDDAWRQSIAARGRQRYLASPWQNMRVIQAVLDVALNGGARLTTPASLESGRREMSRRTDLGETAIIPAGEIHAD